MNFTRNAIDAVRDLEPSRKDVAIHTDQDEHGAVRLRVVDHGNGIAADSHPRLFDAFFTTKPDGMGMGLTISRTLVQAHHGEIGLPKPARGRRRVFGLRYHRPIRYQTRRSAMADGLVNIVDDDAAVRDSIRLLLGSIGLDVRCFSDAQSFLDAFDPNQVACIVLDIRMPGMSGLHLQDALNELGCKQPIIFITGHGDIPMAVQAMRNGAVDFIQKPFRDQDLIDCIHDALNSARAVRAAQDDIEQLRRRFGTLTERERDIFERVATGLANKQIAHELSVSQRTVEIHRAHVMEKLGTRNLAQLVRCHVRLNETLPAT